MIFRRKRKNNLSDMNPNDKINYNENDLLDELHKRCFQSFALTLDTADFVPQNYIDKVYKRIYKVQKKQYKKLGRTNKEYQKWFAEKLPQLIAEQRQKLLQEQLQKQKENNNEQK